MTIELDVQYAFSEPGMPEVGDFETWVRAAMAGRRDTAELTVRVVDEAEITSLNQQYRHKQGPTNVLSFPFEAPPGVDADLLGDIVICAPVVQREALTQGKDARAHWAHLTVHGVLHLLGYDHVEMAHAEAMESLEKQVLGELGFGDPYAAEA